MSGYDRPARIGLPLDPAAAPSDNSARRSPIIFSSGHRVFCGLLRIHIERFRSLFLHRKASSNEEILYELAVLLSLLRMEAFSRCSVSPPGLLPIRAISGFDRLATGFFQVGDQGSLVCGRQTTGTPDGAPVRAAPD